MIPQAYLLSLCYQRMYTHSNLPTPSIRCDTDVIAQSMNNHIQSFSSRLIFKMHHRQTRFPSVEWANAPG